MQRELEHAGQLPQQYLERVGELETLTQRGVEREQALLAQMTDANKRDGASDKVLRGALAKARECGAAVQRELAIGC